MSLSIDGVWKTGVWAQTVWADGVWFEGAYVPPVTPTTSAIGGAGHPTGIYWGVRKHKKFTKTIDWLLDRVVSEYYAELTAPDASEVVKKQAEKIVKPYKEQGKAVNWAKFETDIDRVIKLLELYQREHDLQEDEEKWMMLD